MRQIPLTRGKISIVDDEDYDWLMTWNWFAVPAYKGKIWYAAAFADNPSNIQMHRLLMIHPIKGMDVDHINHNGLDNRKHNLRIITHRENCWNTKRKGTSKYPGVWWNKAKKRWDSKIILGGKRYYVGGFKKEIDASSAYYSKLNAYLSKVSI